ncbi:nucleotide disphospho-sugar-binding domain-containing protein [Actinoplanes teichomyceticus]|uniref:UDP:flavonoid glycosyltransferase YjiC (YdhE family) n=1 Tax=Actinoplanes teichomyceticus TaxID=1867 RepID=A0A561WKA0_ACTTI|nr:nucleotide disphospho-sugar-binding domain-containing protein [Actinoplanes teichomyceticus]TWG24295.1 UDP:flavonoid glycosyltransferase YjiC (YdhE family) [Actinoplanes teichomyceticus]GIF12857.1 glycosyl transferase [Actinoplanes teichomyceticus]
MRVLFLSTAGFGTVSPLVPLTWAFRAAGHDVLVGTFGEGFVAGHAGLPIADIAPGFRMEDYVGGVIAADPTHLRQGRAAARRRDMEFVVALFEGVNRRLLANATRLARTWRPDLVVHEEMAAMGPLVAAAIDVPAVRVSVTFGDGLAMQRSFARRLADLHEGPRRPGGGLSLILPPPSMLVEPGGWPMRFVAYSGGGVRPDWLAERPRCRRVAVTVGTVTPTLLGPDLMLRMVGAARDVDAEFVLALGGAPVDSFGPLPPNVRAAAWLPLDIVLTTCDAIVHHGGANTAMAALDAGVPQLVLPDFADRFITADAICARGAGLSAEPADLTAALLDQLLSDGALRAAARDVRTEIRQLPTPAEIVGRLTR